MHIQEKIIKGELQLAWSYILEYENAANPFSERKETIKNWKKYAVADTSETINIISTAEQLFKKGIKSKDALHVACAIELNCDFFITTDKAIIKKLTNFESINVISPVDFINFL